jgi:hypothetical protein
MKAKKKFDPHQFFHIVSEEKISRFNKGDHSKLTQFVSKNSIKDDWNNTWGRLSFPINVYNMTEQDKPSF